MRAFVLALALLVATPALAQTVPGTSLTLADPAKAPAGRVIIDGASWACEPSGVCLAAGGADQPALRACRRVVARVGAVSAFSWKGVVLSAEQIAACNTAARG